MSIFQRLSQFFSSTGSSLAEPQVVSMKTIFGQVREAHLRCIEQQRGIRRQIQELSWKPGSSAEVSRIRSERDPDGHRKYGWKALKPFRRPETGPDRYELWVQKRSGKDEARTHQVLLGMLRGRTYAQLERNPKETISSDSLFYLLRCYDSDLSHDIVSEISKWISGERASMRLP